MNRKLQLLFIKTLRRPYICAKRKFAAEAAAPGVGVLFDELFILQYKGGVKNRGNGWPRKVDFSSDLFNISKLKIK